jgi:hypothetical protein
MRGLLPCILTLFSAVDDPQPNNVVQSVRAYRDANQVRILEFDFGHQAAAESP